MRADSCIRPHIVSQRKPFGRPQFLETLQLNLAFGLKERRDYQLKW